MPIGQNLVINFDSTNTQGNAQQYAFGDAPPPIPDSVVLDPAGLDFYAGESADTKFANKTAHYVVLQTNTPVQTSNRATFEFKVDDPWLFQSAGSDFSVELTTSPFSPMHHNLSFASNNFEFNATSEGSYIRNGEHASAELDVPHTALWHRQNVICLGAYEAPSRGLSFELGADNVTVIPGFGGVIDPTNYDLNFQNDNAVAPTNYDLNFAPAEDVVIKSYSWDFAAMFHGADFAVDLTTDRKVINNDGDVCGAPTGFTVLQGVYHRESLPVGNTFDFTERPVDNHLNFRFDAVDGVCSFDMNFMVMGNGSKVDTTLQSVKNLNYDVLLCPADTNPELNIDGHNFLFKADYLDKDCNELIVDMYHGSSSTAFIAKDVEIKDVDPEHGHNVDLDLSITVHPVPDAYNGAYTVVNTFSTFPAALLDGDAYGGHNVNADLLTISIFRDVDAYHGGVVADIDLQTFLAPTFEAPAYHGALNEITLLTEPVIQIDDVPHGTYTDLDFTTFPAIELIADAYSGATMDTVVIASVIIDSDSYHGASGDADLTTFESSGFGDIDIYHGGSGEGDLAYTPTLDAEGYGGAEMPNVILNVDPTLEAEGFHGAAADADFTRVQAPELEPVAHHGGAGVFDIALTKALFPRAYSGSAVAFEVDDHPSIELDVQGYGGATGDVFELSETEFNSFASHGATLEDFNLQVTVNFPVEPIEHGSYAEGDEIKRGATLDMDAYAGHNGVTSNFQVPAGETILANAYAGESLTPNLHAPVHALLKPHPIVASQALYDGLGGVGGINHCYLNSEDLDPRFNDNVTRLGFDPLNIEDRLNIDFTDYGDAPWNTCNGGGMRFEWDIQTNARLELQAYAGESVHMFIPLEVMPLIGVDVPVDRLYEFEYWAIIERAVFELEEIKYETTGAVWDHPDDFVAFYEAYFTAELTPTAFAPMYHGAYAEADFVVPVYGWKTAQRPFETGEHVRLEFEPVDYIRFCKGYITPNGNAVVFEFDGELDYDCSIFLAGFGSTIPETVLSTIQSFEPNSNYMGDWVSASLTTENPWAAFARMGSNVYATLTTDAVHEFEVVFSDGVYAQTKFYEPPTDGYGGEHMAVDDLVVPGPGIRWVTKTQCLPNEYVPLTEDGDPDLSALEPDENGVVHVPTVPVEKLPFVANLLAECITFVQTQDDE